MRRGKTFLAGDVLILLGFLLQSLQEVNVVLKETERKKLKKDFSTTVCHSKDKRVFQQFKPRFNMTAKPSQDTDPKTHVISWVWISGIEYGTAMKKNSGSGPA